MAIVLSGSTGIQNPLGSAAAPSESNTTNSNTGAYFPTGTTYGIATNGSNALYIDASQNVAIGTTSPAAKLNVNGNQLNYGTNPFIALSDVNNSTPSYIQYLTSSNVLQLVCAGGANTGYIKFLTGTGNEAARIDASGNLLVGTTATLPGYTNTSTGFSVLNDGTGSFSKTGNITLTVNNNTSNNQLIGFLYQGTIIGSVQLNGTTGVLYNTASDYRLKENVQPMTTGLATIGALKPVTYDWIADKSAGEGFIAHELQSVIPFAVTGEKDAIDDEGKPIHQGVDYSKIVVHLVAALQELTAEVTALKAKVGA